MERRVQGKTNQRVEVLTHPQRQDVDFTSSPGDEVYSVETILTTYTQTQYLTEYRHPSGVLTSPTSLAANQYTTIVSLSGYAPFTALLTSVPTASSPTAANSSGITSSSGSQVTSATTITTTSSMTATIIPAVGSSLQSYAVPSGLYTPSASGKVASYTSPVTTIPVVPAAGPAGTPTLPSTANTDSAQTASGASLPTFAINNLLADVEQAVSSNVVQAITAAPDALLSAASAVSSVVDQGLSSMASLVPAGTPLSSALAALTSAASAGLSDAAQASAASTLQSAVSSALVGAASNGIAAAASVFNSPSTQAPAIPSAQASSLINSTLSSAPSIPSAQASSYVNSMVSSGAQSLPSAQASSLATSFVSAATATLGQGAQAPSKISSHSIITSLSPAKASDIISDVSSAEAQLSSAAALGSSLQSAGTSVAVQQAASAAAQLSGAAAQASSVLAEAASFRAPNGLTSGLGSQVSAVQSQASGLASQASETSSIVTFASSALPAGTPTSNSTLLPGPSATFGLSSTTLAPTKFSTSSIIIVATSLPGVPTSPSSTSDKASISNAAPSSSIASLTLSSLLGSLSASSVTTVPSSIVSTSTSGLSSGSSSVVLTSSTTASASASATCTAGGVTYTSGQHYTDANNVTYVIHCSQDNSQGSFSTYPVMTGGFATCFNACDNTQGCAGFTYSGSDSGNCYLKTAEGTYSSAGSSIVSAFHLSTSNTGGSSSPSSGSTGSTSAGASSGCADLASQGSNFTDSNGNTYQVQCSYDYNGNDLSSQSASSFKGCFATCDATSGCTAFSFLGGEGAGTCYLKSRAVSGSASTNGADSAKLISADSSKSMLATASAASNSSSTAFGGQTSSISAAVSSSSSALSTLSSSSASSSSNFSTTSSSSSTPTATGTAKSCSALLSQGPTYTDANNHTYSIQCGYDFAGNDIGTAGGYFADCYKACDQTSGCAAFSFVGGSSRGTCYLKSAAGNGGQNSNVDAAQLISPLPTYSTAMGAASGSCASIGNSQLPTLYTDSNGASYEVQCQHDIPANDLTIESAPTFQSCFAICDKTSGCTAFSWLVGNGPGTCYLKSGNSATPSLTSSNADVAYLRSRANSTNSLAPSFSTSLGLSYSSSALSSSTLLTSAQSSPASTFSASNSSLLSTVTSVSRISSQSASSTNASGSSNATSSFTSSTSLVVTPSGNSSTAAPSSAVTGSCASVGSTFDGYTVQCNTDHYGGDLESGSASSFRGCFPRCDAISQCVGFGRSHTTSNPILPGELY
ncbi:PAN domain [Teratosphaeria destructans]|uniref:PAN domain n=1 Tax=Teratosphaeria destructans TaxID=418781 RepID=A0A9W7W5N1_9PEZI|nr:PAN domain [Teratosphaeria destructans]